MKRVLLFLCVTLHILSVNAENPAAVQIVKEFGENLSNWCKTKDIRYCDAMTDLTKGSKMCLVSDRIVLENLPEGNESWTLTSFVSFFQKHIHNGINVSVSQFKIETPPGQANNDDSPTCVSCEIALGGSVNIKSKDVFYVRGNKITAIADYGNTQRMYDAYKFYINKKHKEAFDIYWDFAKTSKDFGIRTIAEGFVFFMINHNQGCSHIDKYVKNTFITNKVWSKAKFKDVDSWGMWNDVRFPGKVLAPSPDNLSYYCMDSENSLINYNNTIKELDDYLNGKSDEGVFNLIHHINSANDAIKYFESKGWVFYRRNDKIYDNTPYYKKLSKKERTPTSWYYYMNLGSEKFPFYSITPTVKRVDDKWGYVDEKGNIIDGALNFLFAFPFDRKEGLALVKDASGKWGYINRLGKYVIQPIYDMGQELFSRGKTFVVKDKCLIQIDVEGNELMNIPGYSDMVVSPDNKHFVAYNYEIGNSYDVFDFTGKIKFSYYDVDPSDGPGSLSMGFIAEKGTGLTLQSKYSIDLKKWVTMTSNGRVIRRVPEKTIIEYGYNGPLWITCSMQDERNVDDYKKRIYMDEKISNPETIGAEKIVDLGLSVKWAAWNIGANAPEEEGLHCGWGDPTGMDKTGKGHKKWKEVVDPKTHKWISQSYGGPNPPANICGTSLDVARRQWGGGWRLPSVKEIQELKEKCKWEKVTYKGVKGYLITGLTGNRIFLKSMDWTGYWTGELHPKWSDNALEFRDGKIVDSPTMSRAGGVVGWWSEDYFRPCVRAVCE